MVSIGDLEAGREEEIGLREGEKVVGMEAGDYWCYVKNKDGKEGVVPQNLLVEEAEGLDLTKAMRFGAFYLSESGGEADMEEHIDQIQRGDCVVVTHDFTPPREVPTIEKKEGGKEGKEEGEGMGGGRKSHILTLKRGDVIRVFENQSSEDWWHGALVRGAPWSIVHEEVFFFLFFFFFLMYLLFCFVYSVHFLKGFIFFYFNLKYLSPQIGFFPKSYVETPANFHKNQTTTTQQQEHLHLQQEQENQNQQQQQQQQQQQAQAATPPRPKMANFLHSTSQYPSHFEPPPGEPRVSKSGTFVFNLHDKNNNKKNKKTETTALRPQHLVMLKKFLAFESNLHPVLRKNLFDHVDRGFVPHYLMTRFVDSDLHQVELELKEIRFVIFFFFKYYLHLFVYCYFYFLISFLFLQKKK